MRGRMARMKHLLGFAVLLLALVPVGAAGNTAIMGASKDNTIFANNVNNSAGGWVGLTAGTNGMGGNRRGLIAFDIAGNIPAGSTITSAELTLYLADISSNSMNQTIELHRLTRDWGEGTANNSSPSFGGTGMGAPANPGDATWNEAMFGSVAWTSPGATGDFD